MVNLTKCWRWRATHHIYDSQFTSVLWLLMEQEEVKVDYIVLFCHDTAENWSYQDLWNTDRVQNKLWTCQASDALSLGSFEETAEARVDSFPTRRASQPIPSLGWKAPCKLLTIACSVLDLCSVSVATCAWRPGLRYHRRLEEVTWLPWSVGEEGCLSSRSWTRQQAAAKIRPSLTAPTWF